MRQRFAPVGRNAVLFRRRSFRRTFCRGRRERTSDRSRSRGCRAARPAGRTPCLRPPSRPPSGQTSASADTKWRAARLREATRFSSSRFRSAPWRRRNPWPRPPIGPSRCPVRPRAHRRKGRNVGQRRSRGRVAAAPALISALATKVSPVSSGSGRPSSPADTAVDADRAPAVHAFPAACRDCGWR